MFLQFKKPGNTSKRHVNSGTPFLLALSLLFLCFLLPPSTVFGQTLFGNERFLEPRLRSQQAEQERLERERQRKLMEERQQKTQVRSREEWRPEHSRREISEEEKEFEEKKQYMSYWQRLRHAWKYSDNFQSIFDQTLEATYVPAVVSGHFLRIQSGPGRHYQIIHIAERDETIDFTAIRTEWYQVKTVNDQMGWVHMDELPNTLVFEEDVAGYGFGDIAVKLETRSAPLDLGFSAGFMADAPLMSVYAKSRRNAFFSVELEYGMNRGEVIESNYLVTSLLAHPFSELETLPYLSVGIGRIQSDYVDDNGNGQRESNLLVKAGLGLSRNIAPRLNVRADLNQFMVESDASEISQFTQLSLGTSYVWGSSTDKIFNRTIGDRVKISDTEISLFTGMVAIDRYGSASLTGLRLGYLISEDYSFELSYAQGRYDYSHLSAVLAYNLLPSEFVIRWRNRNNFWPTQVYVVAGSGLQALDGSEQVSFIAGAGIKANMLRRVAMRLDLRESLVRQQTVNNYIITQNPEFSFGLSYFF